jgi:hypothetical protein
MVETINANIREFLSSREHVTVQLESPQGGFGRFWDWIDATGDKDAALREWAVRRNARTETSPQSKPASPTTTRP